MIITRFTSALIVLAVWQNLTRSVVETRIMKAQRMVADFGLAIVPIVSRRTVTCIVSLFGLFAGATVETQFKTARWTVVDLAIVTGVSKGAPALVSVEFMVSKFI
jgi:hypothetical protein